MKTCIQCRRDFCTPYNLRRHMKKFHPLEKQPPLLRMSRIARPRSGVRVLSQTGDRVNSISNKMSNGEQQSGGGMVNVSDDGDTESDEGNGSSSAEESDTDKEGSKTDGTSSDVSDDENSVFDRILSEAERELDNNGPDRHKRLCKLFRQKFIDYLVWIHNLRKNSIYKKVMTIAKDLEAGDGDYSRIEALKAAVNQRKFLLDDLVSEPDSEVGDCIDDQETEDTE